MRLNKGLSGRASNNLVISLVFLLLVIFFVGSLFQYWYNVLDPRLRLAAITQAEILSQSQAGLLSKAFDVYEGEQREKALQAAIEEILLVTDPSIKEPFVKGISLEVDYDVVDADIDSLNIREGILNCTDCIVTEVALMDEDYNLLAIATFNVTDAYYRWLGSDIKDKLINQTLFTLGLFTVVWLIILLLVSRLDRVRKNIEISDRAKTQFLANVSHELRTPLNAILGYTQLFKKDKDIMASQGRGVETIHRSADHLLMLINDILEFSKVDSEGVQLYPKEVALSDFLNTLVEMTEIRSSLKDINFNFEFPPNLPEVVFVDDKRLRQILLNLLNNAVKFTDKGEVTFSINNLTIKKSDKASFARMTFTVADTGIGIPKSKLNDIFVPYQQVENKITRAEGSGLGLTISKNLTELMGSKLHVKSEYGQGSRFWFELKFPIVEQASPLIHKENHTICGYEGRVRKILSIDDNDFNRDIIRQHLMQYGFEVVEAASGEEGLQLLEQIQADLVLLDVLMPDMDGFAVVTQIRSDRRYSHIPVIALTASTQEALEEDGASGFDDVLSKPIVEHDLLASLKKHLDLSWKHEVLKSSNDDALKNLENIKIPDADVVEELKDYARKHNILALRDLLKNLETDDRYQDFFQLTNPLARNYQFGKLVETLENLQSQTDE
ncbi:MAG: response regulator [Pseudomonadales bacterium]|nr:response regulator [Pseudomonadales bacterium]